MLLRTEHGCSHEPREHYRLLQTLNPPGDISLQEQQGAVFMPSNRLSYATGRLYFPATHRSIVSTSDAMVSSGSLLCVKVTNRIFWREGFRR